MNPLVSVVIPCFNHGAYLSDAINSILQQTYKNYEIIVVNDGSTESATINVLNNLTSPNTTVLNKENGHLASARNFGIKNSKADFILLLDADDKFESTFLEKSVNILLNNHKVGFVSCYYKYFDGSDLLLNYSESGGIEKYLVKNNNVACALIRKEIWEQVGGYNENYKDGYEDWDFWIKVTDKGWNGFIIEEPLFYYRVKKKSMIIESRKKHLQLVKSLVENNIEIFRKNILTAIYERDKEIFYLKNRLEKFENLFIYKIYKKLKRMLGTD